MLISNLSVGDLYKNYPALCNALNESVKTNNSKKAQLKEWSRFFEWERIGHKYKITKIYDHPKPKDDTHNKPSTFATAAYKILLYELYKRYKTNPYDNPVITFKKYQLISLLGFTDCLYRKVKVVDSDKQILRESRDDFNEVMYSEMRRIVNNLGKTKVLRFKDRYYIKTADGERIANDDEERIIELKLGLYFSVFGCRNMHDVYLSKKERKFYNDLNSDLTFFYDYFTYQCGVYEIQLECNGEQMNIENAYDKIFGSMTQQEIEKIVYNQRLFLHKHIRGYVNTANKRYVERIKKALPHSYEYYKQKREFFTTQLIQLL